MMEQFILGPVALKKIGGRKDRIVVHHITENTPHRLQLEVEAYYGGNVSFHRVIIT